MRLVLSSLAAPGRSLEELLDAAERKAVAGLELEVGHGHGVGLDLDEDAFARAGEAFRSRGLSLAGLRVGPSAGSAGPIDRFAPACAGLGAPLVLEGGDEDAGVEAALDAGARLLFAFGVGDPGIERVEALREGYGEAVGFAWEARPSLDPSGEGLAGFARRVGPGLRHVRMRGAGPDGGDPEGGSVGALMARLTLAGFDGTCALAPVSETSLPAWDSWLGRRRGWGCNGDHPVQITVPGGGCGCR